MGKSVAAVSALLLSVWGATASIHFTRRFDSLASGFSLQLNITPAKPITTPHADGCTAHDLHGSNNCTLEWNHTYNLVLNANETMVSLDDRARAHLDLMVEDLVPLKVVCPICTSTGPQNCSIVPPKIPIYNGTLPSYNISLPTCPLVIPAGNQPGMEIPVQIPNKDPGLAIRATGEITLTAPNLGGKFAMHITACADRFEQLCF